MLPNGCSGILPIQLYGVRYGLPLEVLECMSTHGYTRRLQNVWNWRPLKPWEQWACCIYATCIIKYTEDISLGTIKSYSRRSFGIFYDKKRDFHHLSLCLHFIGSELKKKIKKILHLMRAHTSRSRTRLKGVEVKNIALPTSLFWSYLSWTQQPPLKWDDTVCHGACQ